MYLLYALWGPRLLILDLDLYGVRDLWCRPNSKKIALGGGPIALQGFGVLHNALIHLGGISLGGGQCRFNRVLRMCLDFISSCCWLLHDNKGDR